MQGFPNRQVEKLTYNFVPPTRRMGIQRQSKGKSGLLWHQISITQLKTAQYPVAAQIMTLLTHFIGRRTFVLYLDAEYLGYLSLFSNIFSILGFAELGRGGIIIYHLYREVAQDDREELGKLMEIYKRVYQLTAYMVAVLGGVLLVFFPYFVNGTILKPQRIEGAFCYL